MLGCELMGADDRALRHRPWVSSGLTPCTLSPDRSETLSADLQLPQDVAWVRVPDAATVLIELLSAHDGPASAVLHLVNPRPIPWRTVFGAYAVALGVPLLPASECLRRLAQSENVPAARLRPFWRMIMQRESEDFTPFEIIDTRKAQALSPALRSMRSLDEADFDSWLAYWMRTGVLERARL